MTSPEVLFGRYEVVRELGAGAMGTVHEAFDRELERRVAIKVLPKLDRGRPGDATELEARERFVREAKILARVHHPNVVTIFDVRTDEKGDPAIVMELVTGVTLRRLLQERRTLQPREVLAIGSELASALEAIHEAGVVHRDVKPANIMLDEKRTAENPRLKLLDLGVARVTNEKTMSRPGAIVGTVIYVSPEQVRGVVIDARADLYAVGVCLFELLEGKPPFLKPTAVETLHAHLYDPVPRLGKQVPAMLANVVTRCLQKTPEARYESAAALGEALRRARESTASAVVAVIPDLVGSEPPASGVPASATPPESTELDAASGASVEPIEALELPALEAPAPPAQPVARQTESSDALVPLELAIDSKPGARAASSTAPVEPSDSETPIALEVDTGASPVASAPFTRTFGCEVCGAALAAADATCPECGSRSSAPLVPSAMAPRADLALRADTRPSPYAARTSNVRSETRAVGPLQKLTTALPAYMHKRLAIGAGLVAVVGWVLTSSVALFLFASAFALYGLVGWIVRRNLDEDEYGP